jgi:hypothetical protein
MIMPFALPDWVPWWVPLALLLVGLLYALAFLFMPFSVLGLKSRLEVIEARLDEIQNEIRHLALRLPAPSRAPDFDEIYAPRPAPPRAQELGPAEPSRSFAGRSRISAEPARETIGRPPIPPAPHDLDGDDRRDRHIPPSPAARPVRHGGPMPEARSGRSEPRVEWPR